MITNKPSMSAHLWVATALYGLNQLVHRPLAGGAMDWGWALNVVVWLVIFVAGGGLLDQPARGRGSVSTGRRLRRVPQQRSASP